MASQTVTLYIDDSSLQLLVTRGKRIKRWGRASLEPGLVRGGTIVNEVEVARIITDLLKAQKVKTKKVVVGMSGLNCLTRPIILPATAKQKLAEAVLGEAKKVLPVPLEHLYLCWRSAPSRDRKIRLFLAAVPRRTVDGIVAILLRAGLKAQSLDLKPLALARLVRDSTAIVIDVQPTEFDIVVMSNGIPQPIRSVPLPDGPLEKKIKTIGDDVLRTVEFYNSNSPQNPIHDAVPLYVAGELAARPDLCQALSEHLGHAFSVLQSPLPSRELPDAGPFLVNIGLALKEMPSVRMAASPTTNLNVLPEAYRNKPFSLTRAFALPAAAAAAAFVIPLAMLLQSASASISSMRDQINVANRLLTQRQAEEQQLKKDITALEKRAVKADDAYDSVVRAFSGFRTSSERLNGDLYTMMDSRYGALGLSHISYLKGVMTIKGSLPTRPEVLDYAKRLHSTGRFRQVVIGALVRVEGRGGEAWDFTLVLEGR
ncbi:MAG: pilus assembly protein PilM [Chloroflexi bacterium]|nr:pilus assembly protein PilM [Chloroflexota bacterium]